MPADVGTLTFVSYAAPTPDRPGRLTVSWAAGAAGAFEKTLDLAVPPAGSPPGFFPRMFIGRVVGIENEPGVNPTANSDLAIFDPDLNADLDGPGDALPNNDAVDGGQDLVTTTHISRAFTRHRPVHGRRKLRFQITANAVATATGTLTLHLALT
jgi:hypothetical protein